MERDPLALASFLAELVVAPPRPLPFQLRENTYLLAGRKLGSNVHQLRLCQALDSFVAYVDTLSVAARSL